jgi:hypothetical protein
VVVKGTAKDLGPYMQIGPSCCYVLRALQRWHPMRIHKSALAWPFVLSAPSLSQSLRNFDITSRMTSPEKQNQNNAQK